MDALLRQQVIKIVGELRVIIAEARGEPDACPERTPDANTTFPLPLEQVERWRRVLFDVAMTKVAGDR